MLPECLGKEFYQKKKFPYPLKLHSSASSLEATLNRATAQCTYFSLGNGPNYSLRVGRTTMPEQQVAENCEAALAQALAWTTYIDGIKFARVQSVTLKAGNAPELPIFS